MDVEEKEMYDHFHDGEGIMVSSRPDRTQRINSRVLESSVPPQNRQLLVLISSCKHQVDDFVGGVTF